MISDIALTVCLSCILAGALQAILPQGHYTKVINQLCSLYILLSAFVALQGLPLGQLSALATAAATPAPVAETALDLQALLCNELTARAEALIQQKGLDALASCAPQPDGSLLVEVTPGQSTPGQLRAAFESGWAEATPYRVVEGGGQP